MDLNKRKERFSLAYINAVATYADCEVLEPKVDTGSVDGILKRTTIRELIGFQAKATSRELLSNDGQQINFPLPIHDYDHLRNAGRPFILVIVLLPQEESQWLAQNKEELCLRHCGYWLSSEDWNPVLNKDNVTVHVPLSNEFNSSQLTTLMDQVSKGATL